MSRTINPNIQYEKNGKPIVGGKVYYGVANQDPKTNPTPIFSDPNNTVAITNPQILTDQGRLSTPVYVGVNQYSFQVDDALDNQQLADPQLEPLNIVGLVTANIDLNGFKIVNAADGTANSDYATFGQNNELYAQVIETIAGSTANAIIADMPVAPLNLLNGQQVVVRLAPSHASNTTTTPTFKLNNFTAAVITRDTNIPLVIRNTGGGRYYLELTYNLSDNTWHLSNPFDVSPEYDNLSDALAGTEVIGSFVETAEYNDGTGLGGNTYKVVAAASGTVDGGSFINKTDGSGNQLQAIWNGDISAEGYGAHPAATAGVNTTAIQNAINFCSNDERVFVTVGKGEYNYTNLFFHFDASDNPGFNSATQQQGRIILKGAGRQTFAAFTTSGFVRGTQLTSTSSTGSASIHALDGQMCRIEDMTLVSNNTTKIVKFDICRQYAGLSNLLMVQLGSGGGFEGKDMFNASFSDVFIEGVDKTTSLGDGFYLYNETVGAGFYDLQTVNVNAFANSVIFGHKVRGSAKRMHGINAVNVQGGGAVVGLTIGGGVAASDFSLHVENNDLGLKIINNARNSTIRTTASGNLKDIEVGSTEADENHYKDITLIPDIITFTASSTMLEIFSSANTDGIIVYNGSFAGDGTNIAIAVEDTVHKNLKIIDPIYNGVATEIDNPSRVTLLTKEQLEVRRTGNTGGVLAEAPFQFIQDSVAGVEAPVMFEQRDQNQPLFELSTPVTVGVGLNTISSKNTGTATVVGPAAGSWAFSRMAMVRTTENGVSVTYWMPLFTAV